MGNDRGGANQEPRNEQNPLAEDREPFQLLPPVPQQSLMARKKRKNPLTASKWWFLCTLALFLISAGIILFAIKLYVPSGREKWSHQLGGNRISSSSIIVNGIIYIGKGDNNVYALSEASGHIIWSNQLGNYTDAQAPTRSGIVPLPIVANGIVYANSQDCSLYALSASTGQNIWSSKIPNCAISAPIIAKGLVYIGSEDGTLYALDAISGHMIWFSKGRSFLSFRTSPAVDKGFIYSAGPNGEVYALDASSGREKWDSFIGGSFVGSFSPAVVNDTIYITTISGEIAALNASTGREKWSSYQSTGFTSSPVVAGNTIYIYSYAGLYALDTSSGGERWFHRMTGTLSLPLVVNGTVYVGTANTRTRESNGVTFQPDNKLYALNATSGNEQWFYQLGGGDYSMPVVSHGIIYVSADDGKLYALLPPG